MKKQFVKLFALTAAVMGFSCAVQADEAAAQEITALSTEEQNFVASLDEQAQQAFSQLNAEQRLKAMQAASQMNANEAVQAVAQADSASSSAQAK